VADRMIFASDHDDHSRNFLVAHDLRGKGRGSAGGGAVRRVEFGSANSRVDQIKNALPTGAGNNRNIWLATSRRRPQGSTCHRPLFADGKQAIALGPQRDKLTNC
jgi:hypothetical protein